LLSDKRCINNPAQHKVVPFIDYSLNPLVSLRAHNREGPQCGRGSQLTKQGAGHYQLELVFGPLAETEAALFTKKCRQGSRKILNRIRFFVELAAEVGTKVCARASLYAADPVRVEKLLSSAVS
jgi:hypothetical protein